MMNPIDKAIADFNMLKPDDSIVVGFSGGADSVTLIHYLKVRLGRNVAACHINHCLRGEESERDEEFARSFCTQYNIPFFLKRIDISAYAAENGFTEEEAGRRARYDFFEEIAARSGAKIATAHTMSDNAETVLLNLTRGAGLKGLCGIPPIRGRVIRPLIYSTRADIEEYCRENGLPFVTDSTNFDDKYSRNNIRLNVIPALKAINPSFEQTVGKTAERLRRDEEFFQRSADALVEKSRVEGGYSAQTLFSAESAVCVRALIKILEGQKCQKPSAAIDGIKEIVKNGGGKIRINGENYISLRGGKLFFEQADAAPYFEGELTEGEHILPKGRLIAEKTVEKPTAVEKVYKLLLYFNLDCDKIIGKPIFRQRKSGDKIEFLNRKGTKELKKLFIDEKLTNAQKSEVPIIADDKGVIAVMGYGVSARAAADETTEKFLTIRYIENDF